MGISITHSFKENIVKHLWTFLFWLGVALLANGMMISNLPTGNTPPTLEIIQEGIHYIFALTTCVIYLVGWFAIEDEPIWVHLVTLATLIIAGYSTQMIELPNSMVTLVSWLTILITPYFFYIVWRWK